VLIFRERVPTQGHSVAAGAFAGLHLQACACVQPWKHVLVHVYCRELDANSWLNQEERCPGSSEHLYFARMDLVVDFADAYALDTVYSKVSPNWLGADSSNITRQFLSLYLIVVSGGHVPALHTPPGQNTRECTTRGAAYT
jgi:hypothetical protein